MEKSPSAIYKQRLLIYLGIILVLTLLAQVPLIINPELITASLWLLIPAGVVMAIYFISQKNIYRKIRFGGVVAHFSTFLIVNLAYHLHAMVLIINDGGDSFDVLPGDWFGPLVLMPVFWGISLIVHLVQSIVTRGYEYAEV